MTLLLITLFFMLWARSQSSLSSNNNLNPKNAVYILNDISQYSLLPATCMLVEIKHDCKQVQYIFKDTGSLVTPKFIKHEEEANVINAQKKKFLSVHGNILYDYFFQSHIDTPYIGNNLQQHTVTTFLDIKIKDEYPMRLYFTTRFGNNNYLRNITNLNLQYTPQIFMNTLRDRIKEYVQQQTNVDALSGYSYLLNEKIKSFSSIKNWLNDPSILQKLVQEQETAYMQKHRTQNVNESEDTLSSYDLPANIPLDKQSSLSWLEQQALMHKENNGLNSDSNNVPFSQLYDNQKKRADSIEQQISKLETLIQSKRDSVYLAKTKWNSFVSKLKNPNEVRSALLENNLPDSILPKGYKTLLAIQKLSIGTSVINYSELSAKGVMISGLQIEYNPKLYYAFAAGVIDYHFRDYLLPEAPGPKQYLSLVRFGRQDNDSNSSIITFYYGRKMLYNYYTTDSLFQLTAPRPNFNLVGFTLEKRIKLTQHSFLTAEMAKSSLPYYHITTNGKQYSSVFSFSNHSNEAYSLKINSSIPTTQTTIEAYFKHYGANFQSFTLISTSSAQNAFLFKANQFFFNKQIIFNGSIRKNDFIDPLLNQRYVSNTVFKSAQATVAIKHLPVISMGFYPMTQLTKLNDVTFSENLFYTLTANVSYMYNTRHTAMATTAVWMRFYNKPTDSGFVYFNTNNYIINHSIFFKQATLQTNFSDAINTSYKLWTWSENVQLRINKWLSAGAGFKYNKQDLLTNPQIGYSVNSTVKINHIGSFQLRTEKTYIPGINRQLVANNTGRITYYHNF